VQTGIDWKGSVPPLENGNTVKANTGGKAVCLQLRTMGGPSKLVKKTTVREIMLDLMLICGVNEQNF
jgi:hypothetical protein